MMMVKSEIDLATSGVLGVAGLSRPLSAPEILVPSCMELGRWGIHWSWGNQSSGPPRRVRIRQGALDSFVRLRTASDENILNFARRNGVLELCIHTMPACHRSDCVPMSYDEEYYYCEPPAAWRKHANMMHSV